MSLVLIAGGLLGVRFLDEPPEARAYESISAPLVPRVLLIEWDDVPAGLSEWPELTPFFEDVRGRGRGGLLTRARPLSDLGPFSTDDRPFFSPRGTGKSTDELTADDAGALDGVTVFDRYRSCLVALRLNSAAHAARQHGEGLRTESDSASLTALAIRALDQRCFEAARGAGSSALLLLVRHEANGPSRYVMAGPGVAVGQEPRDTTGRDLHRTIGALLGYAAAAPSSDYLEDLELTTEEREAFEAGRRRLRDEADRLEGERGKLWFARTAALVLAGMGIVLLLRTILGRPQNGLA